MSSHSAAGTLIYISASNPATFDVAGYEALNDWSLIGEVTNLGEFGREYQKITHNPLASRGTVKKKGSFDEGSIPLECALDNDDAGQIKMKAASLSDADHSFRVHDVQAGESYYFQGLTFTWKRVYGTVNDIVKARGTIEIQTDSVTGTGVVEDLS